MLTTTRAPDARNGGRSSATQAASPGPCSPTLLSMPAPTSCTRGAGLPGHGSTDSDLTTTAPRSHQRAVLGQLGAVPRGPRGRHDRVVQLHGAHARGQRRDTARAGALALTGSPSRNRVQVLQGAHDERVRPRVGHARGGRPRRGQRGQAGHLVRHRRHADVLAVSARTQAARGVHHELHLALRDEIDRVGGNALLPHLGHQRVDDQTRGAQVAGRAQRRRDGEAEGG